MTLQYAWKGQKATQIHMPVRAISVHRGPALVERHHYHHSFTVFTRRRF